MLKHVGALASLQDYVVDKWDEVSVSDEFEQCCQEVASGEYVSCTISSRTITDEGWITVKVGSGRRQDVDGSLQAPAVTQRNGI